MLSACVVFVVGVLAVAGDLASQDAQVMEVQSGAQIALMQKGTSLRASPKLSPEGSSNISAHPTPDLNQLEKQAVTSTAGVWDALENFTLEDLQNATFVPPANLSLELQTTKPGCGVLWYYHIGKCAGSSAFAWLYQLQAVGAVKQVFNLMGGRGQVNWEAFRDNQLEPLISNMAGRVVAVHHHHNGPGLYGMENYFSRLSSRLENQGCKLVRFTLLRKPVPRLISHVNFAMQLIYKDQPGEAIDKQKHDNYFRFALSNPNFPDNQFDNYQVRYTLNNFYGKYPMPFASSDPAAVNAAIRILDSFEVLGLVENLDESVVRVRQLLGLPNLPFPRTNVRKPKFSQHDDENLPADVHRLIDARTELEKKLYENYARKR